MDFHDSPVSIEQARSHLDALIQKLSQLPAESQANLAPELDRLRASLDALALDEDAAEARLRLSEDSARTSLTKYKTLFESFPLGITVSDDRGQVLESNQEAGRLLGLATEEHTARRIDGPEWQIIRPDGTPMPPEEYASTRALAEKRRVENVEMGVRRPDGTLTWINVSATPIPLEGYGVVITYNDITAHRLAEQELALASSRLQTLLENLPIGVVLTDTAGNFLISNPVNQKLFGESGVTGDASGPSSSYHLNYPDGSPIPPAELPLVRALKEGASVQDYEMLIHRENGEKVNILASCSPVRGEDGSIQGAVAAIQDITRLKQAESQQRLLQFREKERLEISRDLHDGPIQDLIGILFNIQFAKEVLPERAVQLEFEQVGQGVQGVIRDLREVCNTLRPPSLIRFGLSRAIHVHAEGFRERHPGLELLLDLRDEGNQVPEPASLALYRIYQEALNNVVRHARARHIHVSLGLEAGQVILQISDDGVGFAFSGNLAGQAGSGHYGLTGMKERADLIGAALHIVSAPGQGTTVSVTLARP